MFKGQKTLTALAISLLFTAPVYAADERIGEIHFKGEVIEAPCEIHQDDIDKEDSEPDDFVMQLHRFCSVPAVRCCLRFRLCRSIRCVYRLLINAVRHHSDASVIHITVDLIRRLVNRSPIVRKPSSATRKTARLARFKVAAQTMTSLPGLCAITDCSF